MSIMFERGKNKNIYESEIGKSKNNPTIIFNPKKTSSKHPPQIYRAYIHSSPLKEEFNKKTLLNTFHYNNKEVKNKFKKVPPYNNLKYNGSFEGNLMGNELLSNKLDINSDTNYENKTIEYRNNKSNKLKKKLNNSMTLNNNNQNNYKKKYNDLDEFSNSNKRKSENNINNTKKINEQFKSLENNIVDKKYEHYIDHDEMIITSHKKNKNNKKENKEIVNSKISKVDGFETDNPNEINFNLNLSINSSNNTTKTNVNSNNTQNSSFDNSKIEFEIKYTNFYAKTIPDEMLKSEVKLLVEKISVLQGIYHRDLDKLILDYYTNKALFKSVLKMVKVVQKKKRLLQKFKDKRVIDSNIHQFLNLYQNKNENKVNMTNKVEIDIWRLIMGNKDNRDILRKIFQTVVINKYSKIKHYFNSIQNGYIESYIKKNKTKIKSKFDNKLNGNNKIYPITLLTSASPIQRNKKIINYKHNYNANINNSKNNHKRTISCINSKQNKLPQKKCVKKK